MPDIPIDAVQCVIDNNSKQLNFLDTNLEVAFLF